MSTLTKSRLRAVVTPQGDLLRATVMADKSLVLTLADDGNKRKGIEIGPIILSGLTADELAGIIDPGQDQPDGLGPRVMNSLDALLEFATAVANWLGAREKDTGGAGDGGGAGGGEGGGGECIRIRTATVAIDIACP